MNPDAEDAIRIAEKHLAGQPPDKREALALDILEAIHRHAGLIAAAAIKDGFAAARRTGKPN